MENTVTIYFSTIWNCKAAGAERILGVLSKQHPGVRAEYEAEHAWLKVTCSSGGVGSIEASFRQVYKEMLEEMQAKNNGSKMPMDNTYIEVPGPSDMPIETQTLKTITANSVVKKATQGDAKKSIVTYQCPTAFDKFNFTKIWKRVKEETPDAITIHSFISAQDIETISKSSQTYIQFDSTDRLGYLGASTQQNLLQASTMLDNVFQKYAYIMPQQKHLLYAETDGIYHVDVRYMAHVNDNMLTSTILDPSQFPGPKMHEMHKAVFAKAVCLRICQIEPFKRIEVSFFGPRARPLFHGQARKVPAWFVNQEYAPKLLGVTAPSPGKTDLKDHSKEEIQTSTLPLKPLQCSDNLLLVSSNKGPERKMTNEAAPSTHISSPRPPPPPFLPSDKLSYQMRQLWEFVNNPSPSTSHGSRPASSLGAKSIPATRSYCVSEASNAPDREKLITTLDDDNMDPNSPAENKPRIPLPESQQLVVAACAMDKTRSALDSALSPIFVAKLCSHIRQIMADLPYRRGWIRLQAELGRIYLMDADPTGLATNGPGQPSAGWIPVDLMNRLDNVCVGPGSVMFTKALSIFANDMEHVIGSAWTLQERRVVYEFKCQRIAFIKDGMARPQSPFVVEIDGSQPGAFKYSIRRLADGRPPIWVHCIRRHWDARITVLYSDVDELEKMYGDFAQSLMQSMVVPPGMIGAESGAGPRFQVKYDHRVGSGDTSTGAGLFSTKILTARVRHVGRHVSEDGESFLDVSWNRHMKLEQKPDNNDSRMGILRATAATDDPACGIYSSWYEANVVSVRADTAFQENQTLTVGRAARWASQEGEDGQDSIFRATVVPALELVGKMDGVGVMIDNGQGAMWTPPMQNMAVVPVTGGRFW